MLCRALLAVTIEDGAAPPLTPTAITIRRFIEANLATVDIPLLTSRFGVSQRSLYRLFPREEVSSFIRDRRLAHGMRTLTRTSPDARPPKLARLAHECGFADPQVFSRAFRRKYGLLPADVQARTPGAGAEAATMLPLAWLREL